MNSTITFSNYFYSKYYYSRSTTSPDAKGKATAHAAGHNHHRWGPAQFRSLDFGERNGYLKGPTRLCSLDFDEHNGYLQGVAPIDVQQKSMGLRTFSCSRDISQVGTPPPKYDRHGWKRSHQTL